MVRSRSNGASTHASRSSEASRAPVQRVAGRPKNLPSSRAVVGGFLVALAALGVFVAARAGNGGQTRRYVVAARDVAPGAALTPADLTTSDLELSNEVGARAFTDPRVVVGRVT